MQTTLDIHPIHVSAFRTFNAVLARFQTIDTNLAHLKTVEDRVAKLVDELHEKGKAIQKLEEQNLSLSETMTNLKSNVSKNSIETPQASSVIEESQAITNELRREQQLTRQTLEQTQNRLTQLEENEIHRRQAETRNMQNINDRLLTELQLMRQTMEETQKRLTKLEEQERHRDQAGIPNLEREELATRGKGGDNHKHTKADLHSQPSEIVNEFLQIPWDAAVLRHETMLSQLTNLNPYEPSTKQLVKKIHTDSIARWAKPDSVLSMEFLNSVVNQSTLLRALGYADLGNFVSFQLQK
ncbi:unnamed protein product [Dicrocoelium dendriticum]|nr:unnamed protein product [Dicrocoelium dendriticum]